MKHVIHKVTSFEIVGTFTIQFASTTLHNKRSISSPY